ncbi:MFS transporter [Streptomyces sp. SID12501]|uniref:MFS transporter n=1 Tax=Streptomyces sp. SID12501 TaxID=2706042 RepID=A0A6B3BSW4_9ACTN|nr:MFS transporter [Streptomyces sp. SID12501]
MGTGLSAATYAMSLPGRSGGLTHAGFYGPLLPDCAAPAAFGVLGRRSAAPLLNTGLFADKVFSATAASSFLAGAIQFGALVIQALYFQLVRGYDVIDTGLAMVGFAVGAAVLPVSGRLTDRFGGGPVSLAGSLMTTVAFIPAAPLPTDAPLLALEACLLLLGIGNALSVLPSSTAAYVTVDPVTRPEPEAHGRLRLAGLDPRTAPQLDLGLLQHPLDVRKMIEAVALGRRLAATAPMRALGLREIAPGPAAASGTELAAYLRAHVKPYPHLCGTAPMGSADDPTAVVDNLGRVHGVPGLRVVDASILPDAPSVATNLTVMMAAELIADRFGHS